jgi:predicted dehydrogenase
MAAKLNWGILGCGGFTRRRILPAFAAAENARVAALQRRSPADAQATAKEFGVPKACAQREELVRDPDVQAVFVASHHAGHLADVLAAAGAGKHVLCEKPLGMNAGECRQMVAACRAAGVKLFVGHCGRYKHGVEKAREVVAAGALGPLEGLRSYYGFHAKTGIWRRDCRLSGGGPLLDLGPHVLDLIRYVSGQEVTEVAAMVEPDRDFATGRVETRARAILKLAGGPLAMFEVSFEEPLRNGFEVLGRNGHLRGDYILSNMEGPLVRLDHLTGDPDPIRCETLPLEPREIYRLQLEDVSRAILEPGHAARCATGEEGLKTLAIIDAMYESGRSGRRVRVNA